jgi:hypothetical protein
LVQKLQTTQLDFDFRAGWTIAQHRIKNLSKTKGQSEVGFGSNCLISKSPQKILRWRPVFG